MVTLGEIAPGKSAQLLAELGIVLPMMPAPVVEQGGGGASRIEADDLQTLRQRLGALPWEAR
ncbi:hypothetical protein D3C81_2146580 [compost metagenome]